MRKTRLAALMRDWAEYGWVIVESRAELEALTKTLEKMGIPFTVEANQSTYSISRIKPTKSARGG